MYRRNFRTRTQAPKDRELPPEDCRIGKGEGGVAEDVQLGKYSTLDTFPDPCMIGGCVSLPTSLTLIIIPTPSPHAICSFQEIITRHTSQKI